MARVILPLAVALLLAVVVSASSVLGAQFTVPKPQSQPAEGAAAVAAAAASSMATAKTPTPTTTTTLSANGAAVETHPCASSESTAPACLLPMDVHATHEGSVVMSLAPAEVHHYDATDAFVATVATDVEGSPGSEAMLLHFLRRFGDARAEVTVTRGATHLGSWTTHATERASAIMPVPATACGADTTAAALAGCTVTVRVSSAASTAAQYSVMVGSPDTATTLTAGQPHRDQVNSGEYLYYTWAAPAASNGEMIAFALTPISGDPDLYISSTVQQPTRSQNQWSSGQFEDDFVHLAAGESGRPSAPHNYYIGVYGFGSSTADYTIMVSYGDVTAELISGQPQYYSVQKHDVVFYKISLPHGFTMLEVSAMPYYGDSDLSVDLGTQVTSPSTSHQYSSLSQNGEDMIVVHSTDAHVTTSCPTTGACTAYINVYGFTAAGFTLVAAIDGTTVELLDGQPVVSSVDSQKYTYFSLPVYSNSNPIIFMLTPLAGDPDIYVSCSSHKPVAGAANTWSAQSTSVDRIFIGPSDSGRCALPATYYAGVTSFSASGSSFTIMGHVQSNRPVELVDGIPQTGYVLAGNTVYYQIALGWAWQDVEFTVSASSGSASLYVNNVWDVETGEVFQPSVSCNNYGGCTVSHALWSSAESPFGDSVTIAGTDENACTQCQYVVAVYAQHEDTFFTLTGITNAQVWSLSEGFPLMGSVVQGQYTYYRAWLRTFSDDVYVTLTSLTGDADLYASETDISPTVAKHQWASAGVSGEDVLVIQGSTLQSCTANTLRGVQCELFIGVYGFRNSTYSILAHLETGMPISLIEGVPQAGFVNTSHYNYYQVHAPDNTDGDISISLSPEYGDPDLFVAVNGKRAGMKNFQYSSRNAVTPDQVVVPRSACQDCLISIAVWGFRESQYTLRFNTATSVISLSEATPYEGHVDADKYQYFMVYHWDQYADVAISITPIYGDPDVFVVTQNPGDPDDLPSRSNYMWRSVGFGSDTVTISHTESNFCYQCNYLIAVYGFSATSYNIVVQLNEASIVPLTNGMPLTDYVEKQSYTYFSFRNNDPSESVTFAVTAVSGRVVLYATNNYRAATSSSAEQGALPTQSQHQWSSLQSSPDSPRGTITVTPATPGWHDPRTGTPYTLGVYGAADSTFVVTATTSTAVRVLQLGVPSSNNVVQQGETINFRFSIPDTTEDITVVTTVLSGQPQIVLSTSHQKPNCAYYEPHHVACHNYTWMGEQGQTMLTVSHVNPCQNAGAAAGCSASDFRAGEFYVGVFAYSDTHFTITAYRSGERIQLFDGIPQESTTHLSKVCPVRDEQTGLCTGDASKWHNWQVSYFQFDITESAADGSHPELAFTVNRACDWASGCPTDLFVYMSECGVDDCIFSDRFPNPDYSSYNLVVQGDFNTIIVPPDSVKGCAGQNGLCSFAVAVMYQCEDSTNCNPETFQAIFATENSVTQLASDCVQGHICATGTATVQGTASKNYEAYLSGTGDGTLEVALQACRGKPTVYACHDPTKCPHGVFSPGADNYEYTATTDSTGMGGFQVISATTSWFFGVQGSGDATTTTEFRLFVGTRVNDPPSFDLSTSYLDVTINDDSATVTWKPPTLDGAPSHDVNYLVYALPADYMSKYDFNMHTPCGLAAASVINTALRSDSATVLPAQATSETTYTFTALADHTKFVFAVVARCDSFCIGDGNSMQEIVFQPTIVSTGKSTQPSSGGLGGGYVFLIILLVLAIIGGVGFFAYRFVKTRGGSSSSGEGGSSGWGTNQYNAL